MVESIQEIGIANQQIEEVRKKPNSNLHKWPRLRTV